MFYARYNPYGVRVKIPGGDGSRAFATKADRDHFVSVHEWDGSNIVWASCTRKEMEREIGEFYILGMDVAPVRRRKL
jgi:hypothetical protein